MSPEEARILVAIIITVIVVGVIIGLFAISVIRHQRRIISLQKANMSAEIRATEKERARLAVDLHDDLGPLLTVVKFQVDHASSPHPEEKIQLEKASRHLDNIIARMREVSYNLMPGTLARKGLAVTLEEFFSQVQSSKAVSIRSQIDKNIRLPELLSINLFRVVQELTHNSLKHGEAKEIKIEMEIKPQKMLIDYSDDGKGFDYEQQMKEGKGLGLQSIRNRVEVSGGKIRVDGSGKNVKIEIPYDQTD